MEGLYYICSENKGADQLRGYREADLRLCFRICKNPVFSRRGSIYHFNAAENANDHCHSSCKPMISYIFCSSYVPLRSYFPTITCTQVSRVGYSNISTESNPANILSDRAITFPCSNPRKKCRECNRCISEDSDDLINIDNPNL